MLDYPGLYIDSVSCSFSGRLVLNGVFLQCQVGEVVGLLGRNGAGKSTLLKIIFGHQRADHKHLKLDGHLLLRKGYQTGDISYLPQHQFLPDHLKLTFLIDLYVSKYREELLAIAFIKDNLNKSFVELSGGMKRLVEALLIIYGDARFVLLDEPFSQLAPLIAEEIQAHIRRFAAAKGFIITDHYYERILEISSKVVLIHNGANYPIRSKDDLQLHGYIP